MADYELYEREVGFRLQLDCWYRYPNERFERELNLADFDGTAVLSIISKRGKRILTDKAAAVSTSFTNVFEYVLTADDFLVLLRGEHDVAWRCELGTTGEVFEFQREMLVKPSRFNTTSFDESGMLFDLEENSGYVSLI
jgi:hypothetical protein